MRFPPFLTRYAFPSLKLKAKIGLRQLHYGINLGLLQIVRFLRFGIGGIRKYPYLTGLGFVGLIFSLLFLFNTSMNDPISENGFSNGEKGRMDPCAMNYNPYGDPYKYQTWGLSACEFTESIILDPIYNSCNGLEIAPGINFLEGRQIDSVEWFIPEEVDFNPFYRKRNFNSEEAGEYKIQITCSNDCGSDSNLSIVEILPAPKPEITGVTAFCKGNNVTIEVSTSFETYTWSSEVDYTSRGGGGGNNHNSGGKNGGDVGKGGENAAIWPGALLKGESFEVEKANSMETIQLGRIAGNSECITNALDLYLDLSKVENTELNIFYSGHAYQNDHWNDGIYLSDDGESNPSKHQEGEANLSAGENQLASLDDEKAVGNISRRSKGLGEEALTYGSPRQLVIPKWIFILFCSIGVLLFSSTLFFLSQRAGPSIRPLLAVQERHPPSNTVLDKVRQLISLAELEQALLTFEQSLERKNRDLLDQITLLQFQLREVEKEYRMSRITYEEAYTLKNRIAASTLQLIGQIQ